MEFMFIADSQHSINIHLTRTQNLTRLATRSMCYSIFTTRKKLVQRLLLSFTCEQKGWEWGQQQARWEQEEGPQGQQEE